VSLSSSSKKLSQLLIANAFRFHVDQGSDLYFDSTILYTSEELRSQAPVQRPSSRHQVSGASDMGIQLQTPTRPQHQGNYYPFMAQHVQPSPHSAQFAIPPTAGGQHPHLGTPGPPGGLPPHFQQQQHGLPPGYANSPVYMGGRAVPPPMMNGIPQNMQIPGMNGHAASPSPARSAFPPGMRGIPPGMNLYQS